MLIRDHIRSSDPELLHQTDALLAEEDVDVQHQQLSEKVWQETTGKEDEKLDIHRTHSRRNVSEMSERAEEKAFKARKDGEVKR